MNQYNENGQKHGYWEERWPDGSLIGNGVYIDGKRDGYWEAYYPNGNIKLSGEFTPFDESSKGVMQSNCIGRWLYFDNKGNITKTDIYDENGLLKN